MASERLDTEDLDEEDLKVLSEVSKKGYYHARPKNDAATTAPQRIDAPAEVLTAVKRTEFDEFQKKWDRLDVEDHEVKVVEAGPGSSTRVNSASNNASAAALVSPAATAIVADQEVVAQLMSMGFGAEESRAAAIATRNRPDAAVEFMLSGGSSSSVSTGRANRSTQADPEKISLLVEMGFSEAIAEKSLRACSNDVDQAVSYAADALEKETKDVFKKTRSDLAQLESDVLRLEEVKVPDPKRLRLLEETLTEVSCSIDAIRVEGDSSARQARREELDRCNALDARLSRLHNARQVDTGVGIPGAESPAKLRAEAEPLAEYSDPAQLSAQERLAEAERLRLAGNESFKAEDFVAATKSYLGALELDGENVAILSNLAAAELRLEEFEAAIAHATAANELSGGFSAKALFRKGQALQGLGRLAEACEAYKAALSIEPSDRLVRQKLQECQKAHSPAAGTD